MTSAVRWRRRPTHASTGNVLDKRSVTDPGGYMLRCLLFFPRFFSSNDLFLLVMSYIIFIFLIVWPHVVFVCLYLDLFVKKIKQTKKTSRFEANPAYFPVTSALMIYGVLVWTNVSTSETTYIISLRRLLLSDSRQSPKRYWCLMYTYIMYQ